MGIGMVLIVRSEVAPRVKKFFKGAKIIGCVEKGERGVELI